ncbi:MAG: Bax inhibitor-1/YccA family protein [Candidatus Nanopelagicales bacterium]|nr:Bax inhibitor-1/YccA family protein [Candidatus Nanopelagicales bacterium]
MQTRNPVLNRITKESPSSGGAGFAYDEGRSAYQQAATAPGATGALPSAQGFGPGAAVTVNDVIVKTSINLAVLIVAAVIGWQLTPSVPWLWIVAMFVGLGLALANIFMKQVKPGLVLAYAFAEGIFLGGISLFYDTLVRQEAQYEGLVSQAIIGTLVAFGVMLALYSGRIIKVNGTFMKVMAVAMVSYLLIALVSFGAALFGVGGGWGFYGVGTLGLLLCAFGVLLAAFTLNLDFEAIKQGVAQGLPERESWRMSFGLLVTLIWLYLEILRLLAILALSRD